MCCVRRYIQYNILMLFHKVLFHSKILSQKQIIYCTGKNCNYRTQNYYPELLLKLSYYELTHKRIVLNGVLKASSHSTLPDDGDHTETYWSYFHFNAPLRTILLCISW